MIAALWCLKGLGRMHEGGFDAPQCEHEIEPGAVVVDHDDLRVVVDAPAPAVEGHDDRAFVGVVACGHAPTLAAQLSPGLDAGSRRYSLRASRNRRRKDNCVTLMPDVGKQQFHPYRISEICLARDECLQGVAVTVIGHEFRLETLFAIIAALERREYRSHAGSAVGHRYPELVHI